MDPVSSSPSTDKVKNPVAIGVTIIALAALGFMGARSLGDDAPEPEATAASWTAFQDRLEVHVDDGHEARREEYIAFVETRLREHDVRLTLARRDLAEQVSAYIDDRKSGIPAYAEEVLTWRNRFKAFWDSEAFRETLDASFERHVLSSAHMTARLEADVNAYLERVALEESCLLGDLRARLTGVPGLATTSDLDEEAFARIIDRHLAEQSEELVRSARITIGGGAVVFGLVATIGCALGGPAAVATGSGSAITAPAVAPQLVQLLIDSIRHIVENAMLSSDEVQSSALRLLDALSEVLMKGDADAWADYDHLRDAFENETDPALKAELGQFMDEMRNTGDLGLDELLRHVQDRNAAIKHRVFLPLGADL